MPKLIGKTVQSKIIIFLNLNLKTVNAYYFVIVSFFYYNTSNRVYMVGHCFRFKGKNVVFMYKQNKFT